MKVNFLQRNFAETSISFFITGICIFTLCFCDDIRLNMKFNSQKPIHVQISNNVPVHV